MSCISFAEPATSTMPVLNKVAQAHIAHVPPGNPVTVPVNLGLTFNLNNSSQQLGLSSQNQSPTQGTFQLTTQNNLQDALQQQLQQQQQNQNQEVLIENRVSVFMLRMVEKAKEYKEKTATFVSSHKSLVVVGALVSIYAGLLCCVLSGNSYLQNADLWSEWNAQMGDELLTIPQEEVAQELVKEIQQRYVDGQNPSDFISPFITFVRDVEEEQKWLNRYRSLYSYLAVVGGAYVFPFEEELYEELEEKIARLAWLKNLYYAWIAEYKLVQHANKFTQQRAEWDCLLRAKPSHATNA